jgi:uncharacterized membrane protein YeaQ/YmgE (transglycosylase-associated protein family)
MNIIVWLLAGGVLGWIAFAFLNLNDERGRVVSILIGAAGGYLGGSVVAPMFGTVAALPGTYSITSVLFAAGVASVFLFAGNLIQNRWGV